MLYRIRDRKAWTFYESKINIDFKRLHCRIFVDFLLIFFFVEVYENLRRDLIKSLITPKCFKIFYLRNVVALLINQKKKKIEVSCVGVTDIVHRSDTFEKQYFERNFVFTVPRFFVV